MTRCERTRLVPAVALLPLLAACTNAPPWTGSVATRDGIEVIANPDAPLLGDARGVVSEQWALQGPTWENPSVVHAASGLVVVVDPQADRVHLVSRTGEMLGSVGRSGDGPGEFRGLSDAVLDGDRLVVFDRGRRGIEYLSLDGAYRSSLRIDGSPWGGFLLGNGELLVKGDFRTDPRESTLGTWIRVADGHAPTPFTPPPLEPLPEEQGVECADLFAWGDDAARLRRTTPEIQVLDSTGVVVREIGIALPVETVSDAERERALDALRRRLAGSGFPPEFQQQSVVVMGERWRVKCRFGPLHYDPSGRLAALLEQNPEEFGSGNATLHLLSGDGVYLAKAVFPSAWHDFTLEHGVAYALTRDSVTDLVTLRAYRVDLPNSVFTDADDVLDAARRRSEGAR
jgi:hypothetical protein